MSGKLCSRPRHILRQKVRKGGELLSSEVSEQPRILDLTIVGRVESPLDLGQLPLSLSDGLKQRYDGAVTPINLATSANP